MEEKNNFIGYEYKDIIIDKSIQAVYEDSFPYFGWKYENSSSSLKNSNTIEIRFKRDRKIRNKAELTRLQRQFEASVNEIVMLEKSKTTKASIIAFTVGILGTAFIAGATFSYLSSMFVLMIILAIPGFLGWILPYFCYKYIYEKKAKNIIPLIEKKYDEIYDICEKANRLLGNI